MQTNKFPSALQFSVVAIRLLQFQVDGAASVNMEEDDDKNDK